MPGHQQQRAPQQESEGASIFGLELPEVDLGQAWSDFSTGWSTANDAAAMAAMQDSVGNAELQQQLNGSCTLESAQDTATVQTTYTVQAGDTLGSITKALGHPVGEYTALYEANTDQLASPNAVEVGQVLQLPEAWTGVPRYATSDQPVEQAVSEPSNSQRAGQALGGAYNAAEAAAGEAISAANQEAEELWAWVFEEEPPDVRECAGPDMELEMLFRSERLNAEQINEARELIEQLPEADQGPWYETLQTKVGYRNQRNNASDNEKAKGGTCNITALAMCLEYLGVVNPHPHMQYEDALDRIRVENNYGPLAGWDTWNRLAEHLGRQVEFGHAGKHNQDWFESKLRGFLQGSGVLCSIDGHVVRIQGMNEDGLVVDDPYGLSILRPRANGKPYSWAKDGRNAAKGDGVDGSDASNKGEDLIWPWSDVVKYNFPTFGVVK